LNDPKISPGRFACEDEVCSVKYAHHVRMEDKMSNAARKQAANLSIRADLLHQAKARHINLSQTLEERLEEILREQDRQAWLEANREAIEDANRFVAKYGVWSDGLRRF